VAQQLLPFSGVAFIALLGFMSSTPIDDRWHAQTVNSQAVTDFEVAESDARADFEEARRSSGESSLRALTAANRLVAALNKNGRGWTTEALSLAERTLRLHENAEPASHEGLVLSLANLADTLSAHARYQEAIGSLIRAQKLQESADPHSPLLAEILERLAGARTASGESESAVALLEVSNRVRREASASPSQRARTLELIASAAQAAGDYGRSGLALQEAAAVEPDPASRGPAGVESLNIRAQQLWFEGRLTESLALSERALALAETSLRRSHPALLEALRYLAATLTDLGDTARSHQLKIKALALAEAEYGAGHYETAGYLNSLAISEAKLGMYTEARSRYRFALSAVEARHGKTHDFAASLRLNLAMLHVRLGDFREAQNQATRALGVWEQTLGPNHPYVATALGELAKAYSEEGRPLQAIPLLERALALREKALPGAHRDVAVALADLSAAMASTGQITRAQRLVNRAIAMWAMLETQDLPEFATTLELQADLSMRTRRYAEAVQHYRRAVEIRERVFGPQTPAVIDARAGLATALAASGDATAVTLAQRAEAAGRDHLRLMLRSLPERQALQYAAARPRALHVLLSLAPNDPGAAALAATELIRGRALVLDEMAARRRGNDADGATRRAEGLAMVAAQQRLANLLVRGPGAIPPSRFVAVVEEARRQADDAEQAAAEASADLRVTRERAQAGLDEVLGALADGTALVAYAIHDRIDATATDVAIGPARIRRPGVPSFTAFVMRRGRPVQAVAIGSVRTIDALTSQWRRAISEDSASSTSDTSRTIGAALRRLVWDPVAPHLAGVDSVFVVPDGVLSLVPFAALPVGRSSYLLERDHTIHYLSAERDVLVVVRERPNTGGLLALGSPSFDTTDSAVASSVRPTSPVVDEVRAAGPCDLRSITFRPLLGAQREIRALSAIWAQSSGTADVLVGRSATEAAFKRMAPGRRVIHLATHGFFTNGNCDAPTGTGRGVGGLATASGRSTTQNPLLISGLALAGANRRSRAVRGTDDGVLTAQEVSSMHLDGVEWAVLSACDTGVGEVFAGEGVSGLRRAFQVAGARTVLMSLWSVDDVVTSDWMRNLYRSRFQRNLSTAAAVREASVSILRDRRAKGLSTSPFYWGAFVAEGDWR
jgi:CHAT domain-containing protein